MVQQLNQTELESFILEYCQQANGYMIKWSEFYDKYINSLEPSQIKEWSKKRVGKEIPPQYPKARQHGTGQFHIANITWAGLDIEKKPKYIVRDGYLELTNDSTNVG